MSYYGAIPPLIPSDSAFTDGQYNGNIQVFGKLEVFAGTIFPTTVTTVGEIVAPQVTAVDLTVTDTATFETMTADSLSVTTLGVTGVLAHTGNRLGFFSSAPVIQATSAIVPSVTFNAGSGTAVNDDSTFNGYTISQIVYSLQQYGILDS